VPVLLNSLRDPTDFIVAGEQMRASAIDDPTVLPNIIPNAGSTIAFSSQVVDEDAYGIMNTFVDGNRLSIRRLKNGELNVRANAGIATPCGAWIDLDYTPLILTMLQASNRFAIAGVTYDSAGAALANCRVVALETGRMAMDLQEAEVGETISDGSGNYSIPVGLNTAYQLTGYKPGAPDVAGITRNDVVPTAVG
jgi:hypothetical protein